MSDGGVAGMEGDAVRIGRLECGVGDIDGTELLASSTTGLGCAHRRDRASASDL